MSNPAIVQSGPELEIETETNFCRTHVPYIPIRNHHGKISIKMFLPRIQVSFHHYYYSLQ